LLNYGVQPEPLSLTAWVREVNGLTLLTSVVRNTAIVVDRCRKMFRETDCRITKITIVDGDQRLARVEQLLQLASYIRRLRLVRAPVRQSTPNRKHSLDSHTILLEIEPLACAGQALA
jgi:hypothetical protein